MEELILDLNQITKVSIDERELLHSSWQSQSSTDIVGFIANEDASHQYNENIACNNPSNRCPSFRQAASKILGDQAKTIQFCEGVFKSLYITIPGRSNSALILSQDQVCGHLGIEPPTSTLEPINILIQTTRIPGNNGVYPVNKSFIMQDSTFSKRTSSVNVADTETETKGCIIHILSKGVIIYRQQTAISEDVMYWVET
ncbi:MAG: hypothetical protein EZS28_004697 [Streblomastix strix]|uniref:Uncharacterized protein n=1 Tax=Streblomastix strix TaxID=222440 RepID=A0A5J4WXH5_9EUKA|nr:MAG: hypothetical protein EZS28_004697 [Streblomastix strix]